MRRPVFVIVLSLLSTVHLAAQTDQTSRAENAKSIYEILTDPQLGFAKAEEALAKGADINATDKNGNTALSLAAWSEPNIVTFLINHKADPNKGNDIGVTPLMIACLPLANADADDKTAQLGTVRLLIGAGADVNARDKRGQTALMRAVRLAQDQAKVRVLLEAGADVSIRTTQVLPKAFSLPEVPIGKNALDMARGLGLKTIEKTLIRYQQHHTRNGIQVAPSNQRP